MVNSSSSERCPGWGSPVATAGPRKSRLHLKAADGQEIGVQDVAAGVNLNVLDEGQLGLALDLQLSERVLGAANDEEEVVAGNVR